MRRPIALLLLLSAVLSASLWTPFSAGRCLAQELRQAPDQGPVSLSWELFRLDEAARDEAGIDADLLAVLTVTPDPGWYTYANADPGPGKRPTVLTVRPTPDEAALPVYYPLGAAKPDLFDPADTIMAYQGPTRLYLPLPPDLDPPLELAAELNLILCQDTRCAEPDLFPDLSVSIEDAVAAQTVRFQAWWPEFLQALERGPGRTAATAGPSFRPTDQGEAQDQWAFTPRSLQGSTEVSGLLTAILLGMLAGLILNVMPCVLPVISLKLTAVLSSCSADPDAPDSGRKAARSAIRTHSLWFALGILLYFLFLAGLLGLGGLAWGELFQDPGAVLSVTVLVFVLGLSMLGVFHLPVVDLKFDRRTEKPRLQALLTGLLATLLATPCSGPFLGGVLSWALSRPPEVVGVVFLGVGLGMALPYLVLAALPGMARCLPKPGAWTWYLEKGIGLFLLGTCIYLLNILPQSLLMRALIVLWLAGVAAWVWGVAGTGMSRLRPLLLKLVALILVVGGVVWALNPSLSPDPWDPFEPAAFRAVLGEKVLLVDFTADWCPTCKALESTALAPDKVIDWEERLGVTAIRVDLTEDFPAGEALLQALGLRSIPMLAVFPAGNASARPLILRDLFTSGQVEAAILQAQTP